MAAASVCPQVGCQVHTCGMENLFWMLLQGHTGKFCSISNVDLCHQHVHLLQTGAGNSSPGVRVTPWLA